MRVETLHTAWIRGRAVAALCLVAALAAGLSGCRPRAVANQTIPTAQPSAGSTGTSPDLSSVGQQDVDSLNGILASVGGAVTSVRSAITADGQTPKG